jgi:WD40 repeat protein
MTSMCLVAAILIAGDPHPTGTALAGQRPQLWAELGDETEKRCFPRAVAFSPGGETLAIACYRGVVRLWDIAKQESFATLAVGDYPTTIAFSPNGKLLAVGLEDGMIRLWDVATQKEIAIFRGHISRVCALAFHPNGKTLVSGGYDHALRFWEVATGKERLTIEKVHNSGVFCVSFSPDGKLVASGCDCYLPFFGTTGEIILWDWPSGNLKTRLRGHADRVESLAFSPDGKRLVSGCGYTVSLWDVLTGKELRVCENPRNSGVSSAAFSPDGKTVASAHVDRVIKLWDTATGKRIATIEGDAPVAFSPDGSILASGSKDSRIRLWDIPKDR